MTQEELVEIAKDIMSRNPDLVLSGSLALALQGKKLRRDPKDLDFYCEVGNEFEIVPLSDLDKTIKTFTEFPDLDYEDSDESDVVRLSYTYKNVDVDVFITTSSLKNPPLKYNGIDVVHPTEIMEYKLQYALDTSSSRFKHKDDIMFYLLQNVS